MRVGHLFFDAVPPEKGERFDTLLRHGRLHVERIVSSAEGVSPSTYVQRQDEWVLLVQGEAVLEVEGLPHALKSGDHLFLPAGTPHKVLRTSQGAIWLAVHLHPDGESAPSLSE